MEELTTSRKSCGITVHTPAKKKTIPASTTTACLGGDNVLASESPCKEPYTNTTLAQHDPSRPAARRRILYQVCDTGAA